jgi:exosortase/archaeosortase family protein
VVLALGFSALFLSASFLEIVVEPLSLLYARIAGLGLGLLGAEVSTSGPLIHLPNLSVEVVHQCTGIGVAVLLFAAVLAFPSSWRAKIVGIGLSVAVMAVVNLLRIASLCWVGMYSLSALEIGHLYVWPPVVMIAAVATLLVWIQRFVHARG